MIEEILGKHYHDLYKGKVSGYEKTNWLQHILQAGVSKIVLIKLYEVAVVLNQITAIEFLPQYKKQSLVDECRATGINFTNETLIRSCRILYVLKSMSV